MNDEIVQIPDALGNMHECRIADFMHYNGEVYVLFEPTDPTVQMMPVMEVHQAGEDVQCIPVTDEKLLLELLEEFRDRMISARDAQKTNVVSAQQVQPAATSVTNFLSDPTRNKWIALVLCFFLGCLGIHKFYEGKIGMGFVYLFTIGFCGIGVLIDLFVLLFKPTHYIP